MKIAAISDLHIVDRDTPEWSVLMQFLSHPLTLSSDRIILMGDIFDLLVGGHSYYYHKFSPFFDQLVTLAARGIKIDYIEGNHDFAFEKLFEDIPNICVHRQAFTIDSEGKTLYFGHGDEIESSDWKYRLYTGFIRSFAMRWLINAVPSSLVGIIGKKSSRYSRQKGARRVNLIGTHARIERYLNSVKIFLSKNPVDALICGHSHYHCDQFLGRTHYLNPGRAGHTHQFVWIDGEEQKLITLQSVSST